MALTDLVPAPPKSVLPTKYKFPKDIGPQFVNKYMPWVESYWHQFGRYPTVADWITEFGWTSDNLIQLENSKFWLKCLERRGIALPNSDSSKLNAEQIAAITIITNFNSRHHPVARLEEAGITEEQLNGWYQNKAFTDELARRADNAFENIAPDATVELARAIKRGNFQAIKFYYEITGRATSPEAVNVKRAMQVLIEAVQKHVHDPAVLDRIAQEVAAVRGLGGIEQ